MNIPPPVNVDQIVESLTMEKEKSTEETTTRKLASSSAPDDILDDIASTMLIKTNLSSENSNIIKPEETAVDSRSLNVCATVIPSIPEKDTTTDDETELSKQHNDDNETSASVATPNVVTPCDKGENGGKRESHDLDLPSPETEEDDEIRLAMEMAMAAAKNPHLSPSEIQKLVGEKNAQAKMIDEFSKQNEVKIKQNQMKNRELQRLRSSSSVVVVTGGTTNAAAAVATTTTTTTVGVASSWWLAAAKKAEEMKDRAERSLYAEQISNDPTIIELRKTMKILKKTFKAHRLQGNRVETRHAFKRQRMERRLMQSTDKLKKTQEVFTNSSYNVQEYIKAMMRASKKWRKVGSDDELLLEAQLSRNMHQMLALEKQKVKCKKSTKEMKKYLQRCKGWLSDKKAFCEMNIMTIDATQNSILRLYEETLRRQDKLIRKCKASEEFQNIDLSDVDLSHVTIPIVSYSKKAVAAYSSASTNEQSSLHESFSAMRGLPIVDSIRKKKGYLDHSFHSEKVDSADELAVINGTENRSNSNDAPKAAISRRQLLEEFYKNKKIVEQHQKSGTPELYVVANKDDESVSSRLSDPDASFNNGDADIRGANNDSFAVEEEESDDENDNDAHQNDDAPWNAANRQRYNSNDSSSDDVTNIMNETTFDTQTQADTPES